MAYMHKETFNIYHNNQHSDDYVEIDELIAPIIQILNRKCYKTIYCCSGHPLNDWLINGSGESRKFNAVPYSYIMFKKGIFLPTLPPEFVIEPDSTLVIRKYYTVNSYFEISRNILETMEQLYEWALDLPDFKDLNNTPTY